MKLIKLILFVFLLTLTYAQNTITVTSPNSGERWQRGTSKNITWTHTGTIADVKIEYSNNNGSSWIELIASTPNTGSYAWNNISTPVSNLYKIRISDVLDANTFDESNSTFSIVNLAVLAPNGNEKWQVGATQNITWAASTDIANIKIEYYNGAAWTQISASVNAALGTYSWIVPNVPSNQIKIRLTDTVDPLIVDESDNTFSIVSLAVVQPNGGNVLQVGKNATIQWNASAYIDNVKLEYSIDNGASWTNIANSLPVAPNTYTWTIPNTPTTGGRIRVSDVANSTISDISDAAFTISNITVLSPNGGENFLAGSTKQITWLSQNVTNVAIQYSVDNGANFTTIVASTMASAGSYTWTVPANNTLSGIIKIYNADNPTIEDISNNVFTISSLALTAPTSASVWRGGTIQNITWTSTNVSLVKLEYSIDNGTNWTPIAENIAANLGTYAWTLPNNPSFQAKVRISNQLFQDNFKVSDAFELEPVPTIVVNSPNGGENWQELSSKIITWSATYNIANVKIDLSTDGGATYPTAVAASVNASTGSYSWTVPSNLSNLARIRVANVLDANVNDVSNANFTISRLILNSPNGGERLQGGKTYNITWTPLNINNVKLEYTLDGTNWVEIANNVQATLGTYSWTMPNSASTTARVRISDASISTINDQSNANFTIATLSLLSPNGGENLLANTVQPVLWNSQNITNVKIEYSIDGGTTWVNPAITNSTAAVAGTFNWTTPSNYLTTYKVKISDVDYPSITAISQNNFTVSLLELTSPITAVTWSVGATQSITWNASPNVTNVKIDYSTNNGGTWINIVPSVVANLGTYSWLVPNNPSNNCKVRVSNVSNPDNKSESPVVFTIAKSLDLISPNGSEQWEVGSLRNITWTRLPAISHIRLEYSIDNGLNWVSINNFVDASLLSFTWTVPNALSTNCKIKITDVNNIANTDESQNTFSIVANPTIVVTRPNGGESFETGAQENITWTSINVQFVKIEYSLNNGASWLLIKSNEPSTGSYTWNVPNVKSTQCRIRITNENNANVFDLSDNAFAIVPRITVTAPNGGENLPVASAFNITWSSVNTANVKIEYTTDNGTNWSTIISSTPAAAGSYSWTVPNLPSSQCKIKISDLIKPEIFDISDNNFTISSKILLTRPNGGENWQVGSIQDITWTSNNVANVSIHYSTDEGISWTQIVASVPAVNSNYKWTVADISGNKTKIKVADASNSSVFDISDNVFTITKLVLIKPVGNEDFAVGSVQQITWTSSQIANVKLEYTTNNETDWRMIATSLPSNGIYYWEVPNTPSSQCKIRISDATNPLTLSKSANLFKISDSPTITVTNPNNNKNIIVGKSELIKWNSTYISDVKIEYSINGGINWNTIVEKTPSTGTYNWVIPNNLTTQGRIKITDFFRSNIFDISDSNFAIIKDSKLNLIEPIGGASLVSDSFYKIKWTSDNVDSIKIEYSINNGVNWSIIIRSFSGKIGSYDWLVPTTLSDKCKIRITDTQQPTVTDQSITTFTITKTPKINLLAPTSAVNLKVGDNYLIKWSSESVEKVRLEYSITNGATWKPIDNDVISTGTYNWIIPNDVSLQCLLRISDSVNPNVFAVTPNKFTISQLELLTPSDNEILLSGDEYKISWKSNGVINIKIEYTDDEGKTWKNIVSSLSATINNYKWTVPDYGVANCKIRISDKEKSAVRDSTKNSFTIKQIILVEPSENETLKPGETLRIQWRSYKVNRINIENTDNAGAWKIIRSGLESVANYYEWTVPTQPIKNGYIKVSNALNTKVFDISRSTFTILEPVDVKEELIVPSKYQLFQNYPNPFNPTTIIKYTIPEANHVILKVFNMLGTEIITLVNEYQNSGVYEVQFDARNLSSGVYLYKIQAGKFVDSKKLLLLK